MTRVIPVAHLDDTAQMSTPAAGTPPKTSLWSSVWGAIAGTYLMMGVPMVLGVAVFPDGSSTDKALVLSVWGTYLFIGTVGFLVLRQRYTMTK